MGGASLDTHVGGGESRRWASWRLSALPLLPYLSASVFILWLRCLRHGLRGGVTCAASEPGPMAVAARPSLSLFPFFLLTVMLRLSLNRITP